MGDVVGRAVINGVSRLLVPVRGNVRASALKRRTQDD
jgi:hypothetical protein